MQIAPCPSISKSPLPLVNGADTSRNALWDHCRNVLGIARLLEREGRARPLVTTACTLAMEMACRAALEQTGHPFEGSLERALDQLGAPTGLNHDRDGWPARGSLDAAERVVAWVASYLRRQAPEKSWGI